MMSKKNYQLFVLAFFYLFSLNCYSSIDTYSFDDPALAKRFTELTHELRCPKCQNQNLADSNSTLSVDLKQIVYEKILAGKSDRQIKDFMKQRYGEFILFRPEMSSSNAFLWSGPVIFLILFLVLFLRWYRNNRVVDDE